MARKVDPVAPVIDAWLAADPRLKASVIHERLVAEHGFTGPTSGSSSTLRRPGDVLGCRRMGDGHAVGRVRGSSGPGGQLCDLRRVRSMLLGGIEGGAEQLPSQHRAR